MQLKNSEGNKSVCSNKSLKSVFKNITMENIRFTSKGHGLILLLHGDCERAKAYGNYFYLKLEPNNTKIITRKSTSPLFWLKYSPEFGDINIVVHGWLNRKKTEKGYKRVKDGDVYESYNDLERIYKLNGIKVLKVFLDNNNRKEFEKLQHRNSEVFPWHSIEVGGRKKNLSEIGELVLQEIKREEGEVSKMEYETNIETYKWDDSFKETTYTMERVKEGFSQTVEGFISKLKKKEKKLVIIFEGMDASGKGSAIKKAFMEVDPSHYDLYRISEPYRNEKNTHFLKRFIPKVFNNKPIAVFDRSWYGRVLVEKVEKLDFEKEISNSFEGIYRFEKGLKQCGIHVLKFWMDISPDEQMKRFKKRIKKTNKRWKIDDLDWKNRLKLKQYKSASEDMFRRTSYDFAPWVIIQGDNKKRAEIAIKRNIMEFIEKKML